MRNEVSRLKADFEQLCADGKISNEIKILMNSMFMIIELMLSIFLERVTKKNNKNSSIPSSQTDKDDSALPLHPGSKGKGKQENKITARNTRINGKRKKTDRLYNHACMLVVDGCRFDSDREVGRAKQGLLRIKILSRKTPITGMWLASCHFQGNRIIIENNHKQ